MIDKPLVGLAPDYAQPVPREPTQAMMFAGSGSTSGDINAWVAAHIWRAMWDAAPKIGGTFADKSGTFAEFPLPQPLVGLAPDYKQGACQASGPMRAEPNGRNVGSDPTPEAVAELCRSSAAANLRRCADANDAGKLDYSSGPLSAALREAAALIEAQQREIERLSKSELAQKVETLAIYGNEATKIANRAVVDLEKVTVASAEACEIWKQRTKHAEAEAAALRELLIRIREWDIAETAGAYWRGPIDAVLAAKGNG